MASKQTILETFNRSDFYDYDVNIMRYKWSVRLFRLVRAALKVNLTLNDQQQFVKRGQIFVINHFSRFETFIPQYLIYEYADAFCCSITHSEFFKGDDAFARYLLEVGGIPHDYSNLFPLLATQMLRGRKVIIFPEGGMVKDRRVVNSDDGYMIYSRTRKQWRKQHTGAAVLGICLDLFKRAAADALNQNDTSRINAWLNNLKLKSANHLREIVQQPTMIVPVNITFYPIRVNENFLLKGAKLLNPGIRHRHLEELLIESNIVLRDTDMNINVGEPIDVSNSWSEGEQYLTKSILSSIASVESVFNLNSHTDSGVKQLSEYIYCNAENIRDQYAHNMYQAVTVNLSHLASLLIMQCVDNHLPTIKCKIFRLTLYLALKIVHQDSTVFLHDGLRNPELYRDLLNQNTSGLKRFINMAIDNHLIEIDDDDYVFLPKLTQEYDLDEIRIENLIAVYANEASVIKQVVQAVSHSFQIAKNIDSSQLARMRFEDEEDLLQWDIKHAPNPDYAKANVLIDESSSENIGETATEDPAPFLLEPKESDLRHGVLVIHGLLASPAEVRPFAEYLVAAGYVVLGIRLKGHGTSPLELASISRQEWFDSVNRGYEILSGLVDHVHLVGFSTGGALALLLAAERPNEIDTVAAVCVPVKFQNPNMMLISLLHGVNRFTQWVATTDVIKAFVLNDTEHPHINYRHVPVSALYELRQLIDELEHNIKNVICPVALLQAQGDPVVDPTSAIRLYEQLNVNDATLIQVASVKHGILYDNTEHIWERISGFLMVSHKNN